MGHHSFSIFNPDYQPNLLLVTGYIKGYDTFSAGYDMLIRNISLTSVIHMLNLFHACLLVFAISTLHY